MPAGETGHIKACATTDGGDECADSIVVVSDTSVMVGTLDDVKTSTYDVACLPAE